MLIYRIFPTARISFLYLLETIDVTARGIFAEQTSVPPNWENSPRAFYQSLNRLCHHAGFKETWMRGLSHFLRDEKGATAIEYGLICAVVFLGIVGAIQIFGTKTVGMYANIVAAM